jgi:hypothetical protein
MSLLVRLLLGRHFDRAAQRTVRTARVITFVITDDCVIVPSTLRQRCGNAAATLCVVCRCVVCLQRRRIVTAIMYPRSVAVP